MNETAGRFWWLDSGVVSFSLAAEWAAERLRDHDNRRERPQILPLAARRKPRVIVMPASASKVFRRRMPRESAPSGGTRARNNDRLEWPRMRTGDTANANEMQEAAGICLGEIAIFLFSPASKPRAPR